MTVDILAVGSGNVRSIKNWIEKSNVPTRLVDRPEDIKSELLLLPGVGSAGPFMEKLKAKDFDTAIKEHVGKGNRLLGICLGFQILSNYSTEDNRVEGLRLLNGHVERLPNNMSNNGWQNLKLRRTELNAQSFGSIRHLSRKDVLDGRVFYNHEYGFVNNDDAVFELPINDKLSRYSGLLIKDNIIGIQFHPEKSQIAGSELIKMIL